MAAKIPVAKYVELPDEDHLLQALTPDLLDLLLNKIEEFITGVRHRADPDRALATIMFTDMVRSTEPVPEMGDSRWRELLNDCYAVVRNELTAFRGREEDGGRRPARQSKMQWAEIFAFNLHVASVLVSRVFLGHALCDWKHTGRIQRSQLMSASEP